MYTFSLVLDHIATYIDIVIAIQLQSDYPLPIDQNSNFDCKSVGSWKSVQSGLHPPQVFVKPADLNNKATSCPYFYPARACASKGLCDRSWRLYIVCILYIVYKSALFFGTNLISPKILTFRGLF